MTDHLKCTATAAIRDGMHGCLLSTPLPNNAIDQTVMSLSRLVFCAGSWTRTFRPLNKTAVQGAVFPRRTYASAKKQAKSTATFIPGSQQRLTDPAAQAEYSTAESSMRASIEWYRKECASVESRASGRITPALLSPVRVKLPDGTIARLEEVATIGVREGTTLLITVFQEDVRFIFFKCSSHSLMSLTASFSRPSNQSSKHCMIPKYQG